ncbi:MAG: TonB family protein [Terriglobales bacterium]
MSRPDSRPDDSLSDPIDALEHHLAAGFPADLALDLVLNGLVVRAAEATHASAAALALLRNNEMVCRAATGNLAPGLGIPLNARDGLSGVCLETRQPQLSVDTEFDPRVDPEVSRRLGIRSILIVPVFDLNNRRNFAGVLEVFSASPAAFSSADQEVLESFAAECARISQAAVDLSQRKPKAKRASEVEAKYVPADFVPLEFAATGLGIPDVPPDVLADMPHNVPADTSPVRRAPYEAWTLVLGGLTIFAAIGVSALVGSRIGWLLPSRAQSGQNRSAQTGAPDQSCAGSSLPGCAAEHSAAGATSSTPGAPTSSAAGPSALKVGAPSTGKVTEKTSASENPQKKSASPPADELVVYEKGKVIFRMRPAPTNGASARQSPAQLDGEQPSAAHVDRPIVQASSTTKIAASPSIWLSAGEAEARLVSRSEPRYPPEAIAAHRAGNVVLEVHVAEDGSVSTVRTISGDPILATAAAEAVRNWRYQPYRQHDQPSSFQTDVTLSFALPN